MIDLLRISIPFDEAFVVGDTAAERINGLIDLRECNLRGVKLESGDVIFNDGQYEVNSLRHPYESIPSSWSTLSFKIHSGGATYWPFVEIKGSPAKLLQGHNVYGSDDVWLCIESLLSSFLLGMPRLSEMLDVRSSEIKQIDCTYSAQLPDENVARNVIHGLRNISSGQTRSSRSSHDTTAYWGVSCKDANGKSIPPSRHKQLKAYLKHFELEKSLETAKSNYERTKKDCYLMQIQAINQPSVQIFARNALRFEASVLPRMLKRLGFRLRVSDFLEDCKRFKGNPIQYLWSMSWDDIFKTFEGAEMNIYDDEKVRQKLRQEFIKVSDKTGKVSYSKADRLFRFFRALKSEGWDEIKATTPKNTFYVNIRLLSQVVSKAYLQNLNSIASNVVPLIRFIDVDFSKQLPDCWQEPKPLHVQLRNGLKLAS